MPTGVDPDRRPEEKAYGIMFDLGFVYAPLSTEEKGYFIDVSGHDLAQPFQPPRGARTRRRARR